MSKPNNSTLPSVISVDSGSTYIDGLNAYTQAANQLCDSAVLTTKPSKAVKKELKTWFKHKPSNEQLNQFKLLELSRYISSLLINPLEYGALPFVDMLYLTIDAPESVVSKLSKAMKSMPMEHFKRYKTGTPKVLKNNKDIYQRFAQFKNHESSMITIYWGLHPKVRENRPNQRLVKITLNPARHSPAEITAFFAWFKSLLGDNADQIMEVANVTRLDIAMDMVGIPLPYLLIDRPNIQIRNYYLNAKARRPCVGTQKFGCPNSTCFHAYNKVQKYCDIGPFHIPILAYKKGGEYLPMSRVERVFRPADTIPISLGQLERAPYFLKGTVFYSPMILTLLNEKQLSKVEKYGFSYWYHVVNKKRCKISPFQLKRQTLKVNDERLKSVQLAALIRLKKLILEA